MLIIIVIWNYYINCLVRINSVKYVYILILYLICKVVFILLILNKKKCMEVNYSKLIFINYCIVGMNCILYVVWGIVSKKNLFWCKVEMLNIIVIVVVILIFLIWIMILLLLNEIYRICIFCLIFFYLNLKKIIKEKWYWLWVFDDVLKVVVINYW